MLEQQQREFGQVRELNGWYISKDYIDSSILREKEQSLIEKYGLGLGIAVFDFMVSPHDEKITILAEQLVIKSDQGSQEDRVTALTALLEAVVLRANRDKFH